MHEHDIYDITCTYDVYFQGLCVECMQLFKDAGSRWLEAGSRQWLAGSTEAVDRYC